MITSLACQINNRLRFGLGWRRVAAPWPPLERPNLSVLAQNERLLPAFVRNCPTAMKYLRLLGPLDWAHFPERPTHRPWPGPTPHPRAPFVAAYLVKLHEGKTYMSDLRDYLVEHPALVWLLGFQLKPDPSAPHGFDPEASVPGRKQLGRVLRELDNAALQFLLDSSVQLIRGQLPAYTRFGDEVSMDTKHLIAWVAENNPKAYVKESDRLDKTRQPAGDRDCKLGCKRKRNQGPQQEADAPESETSQGKKNQDKKGPRPTNFSKLDEYYWGYASGVVATKVPGCGEFVLAELTQTFDKSDVSYFFPLMADVERRLDRQPRFAAFDAAFDAFYVYDYFAQAGGFAAVPFSGKGGFHRTFDQAGRPLCQAGLGMPCGSSFMNYRGLVPQRQGRYVCPLLFPEPTGRACPIDHRKWLQGGCVLTTGVSVGARLRYLLNRDCAAYQRLYNQRTATERVNSQAVELGIERPKLRNQRAITNQNTLTYVLINLRSYHRLRKRDA
jgi:hypothetical protein